MFFLLSDCECIEPLLSAAKFSRFCTKRRLSVQVLLASELEVVGNLYMLYGWMWLLAAPLLFEIDKNWSNDSLRFEAAPALLEGGENRGNCSVWLAVALLLLGIVKYWLMWYGSV